MYLEHINWMAIITDLHSPGRNLIGEIGWQHESAPWKFHKCTRVVRVADYLLGLYHLSAMVDSVKPTVHYTRPGISFIVRYHFVIPVIFINRYKILDNRVFVRACDIMSSDCWWKQLKSSIWQNLWSAY